MDRCDRETYERKCRKLNEIMEQYARENVMLAFSGGVDSSLLLTLACEYARKYQTTVWAVTIHTTLHPAADVEETAKLAGEAGAVHRILYVDELKKAGIEKNPENRCYLCKKYMFAQMKEMAGEMGISCVIEGTNVDDTKEYRPGIRALGELGILSPLKECGFTKADVRKLAEEKGISTANKPSTPCLATRFPYNTLLSYEEMRKAEKIETKLKEMGFYNVRARIHGDLVRLEVDQKDIGVLVKKREELTRWIKTLGYRYITADLEGFRSGSQDSEIVKREEKGGN